MDRIGFAEIIVVLCVIAALHAAWAVAAEASTLIVYEYSTGPDGRIVTKQRKPVPYASERECKAARDATAFVKAKEGTGTLAVCRQ